MLSSAMAFAQQPEANHEAGALQWVERQQGCVLLRANNGQVITVRGKVFNEPHDLGFGIPGCNDTVLLTYAGDPDNDVSVDQLK